MTWSGSGNSSHERTKPGEANNLKLLSSNMTDFSLELNEDQLQIQKWVHDFAENVVRPAAAEWDEKEETPWPIIQEAADIGLYSLDFILNAFNDPVGIT